MRHIIREDFNNIEYLLRTINTRENNRIMRDKRSSQKTDDPEWSGTRTYEDAVHLLREGYTDILGQIKDEMRKAENLIEKEYSQRHRPENKPVGFIPHVPNAIQNRPDSMIDIRIVPQKAKTINIVYGNGDNCSIDAKDLLRAGAVLISALNIVERSGIQTNLKVCFMGSYEDGELICPTLQVKDFGERFNLAKVCFPMAHPSMFRRIGFKYLETCPEMEENFRFGYGSPARLDQLEEVFEDEETKVINTRKIMDLNYDIEKVLEYLNLVK